MTYQKQWGSSHPGCIIFLLDQSGSMSGKFSGNQIGSGRRKIDMVSTVLNNLLYELVQTNTTGTITKPRADVAVLAYGSGVYSALSGSLKKQDFVTLAELKANPIRIEQRQRQELDESGSMVNITVDFPVWVDAQVTGDTPMCAALRRARELAKQWIATHPDNYPPVVVHVSDGGSTDGNPTKPAKELCDIQTSDGNVLLFNCHITDINANPVEFVANESDVPSDSHARLMFAISSEIPESARNNIAAQSGNALPYGARGFIFNGDANSVKQMFTFATVGAMSFDPNQ